MDREQRIERMLAVNFLIVPDFDANRRVRTVGPFDQKALDLWASEASAIAMDARKALAALSDDEFAEGFRASHFPKSEAAKSLIDSFKSRAREMRQFPWYHLGLGHPNHQASYRRWSAMAHLSLNEATCLTLGVEPSNFSSDELRALSQGFGSPPPVGGEVGHFIGWRFEVMRRRFDTQDQGDVAILTSDLTAWIEEVELEIPDGFRKVFMKRFAPKSTDTFTGQDAKMSRREMNNIAKLLTAIAADQYGYDPASLRGRAPAKLKDIADRHGLEISVDTILKILRTGL